MLSSLIELFAQYCASSGFDFCVHRSCRTGRQWCSKRTACAALSLHTVLCLIRFAPQHGNHPAAQLGVPNATDLSSVNKNVLSQFYINAARLTVWMRSRDGWILSHPSKLQVVVTGSPAAPRHGAMVEVLLRSTRTSLPAGMKPASLARS